MIREDCAGRGCVREDAERVEIGNEPDLAHGAHPCNRLQMVEPVHRLQRNRQADAAQQAPLQPVPGRRLRADRAVVAAPQEADEADTRLVHLPGDLVRPHAGVGVGVGASRLCMYSLTA